MSAKTPPLHQSVRSRVARLRPSYAFCAQPALSPSAGRMRSLGCSNAHLAASSASGGGGIFHPGKGAGGAALVHRRRRTAAPSTPHRTPLRTVRRGASRRGSVAVGPPSCEVHPLHPITGYGREGGTALVPRRHSAVLSLLSVWVVTQRIPRGLILRASRDSRTPSKSGPCSSSSSLQQQQQQQQQQVVPAVPALLRAEPWCRWCRAAARARPGGVLLWGLGVLPGQTWPRGRRYAGTRHSATHAILLQVS